MKKDRDGLWKPLHDILLISVVVFGFITIVATGGGGGDEGGSRDGDGDSGIPTLGARHSGWKNPDCTECHDLPVDNHIEDKPYECAGCHGGNGACNPNGIDSSRQDHQTTDNCLLCHTEAEGYGHGFVEFNECVSCHFADKGTIDCGYVVAPPTELISDCTPTSRGPQITISEGDQAIDFTLKDVDGTSYTLSTLLETKPVLMIFGGFT